MNSLIHVKLFQDFDALKELSTKGHMSKRRLNT
uniref:Uncharacterized protein n=1 Tax=Arundo donax TaxID=35708 RepID=A0A0A9GIS2_ARUDO